MKNLNKTLLLATALISTIPHIAFAAGDDPSQSAGSSTTSTRKAYRVLTDEEIEITSRTFDKFIGIIANLEFSNIFQSFRSDFFQLFKNAELYSQLDALDTSLKPLNVMRLALMKAKNSFLEFAHNQRLNNTSNGRTQFNTLVTNTLEPIVNFIAKNSLNTNPEALLEKIRLAMNSIRPYSEDNNLEIQDLTLFAKQSYNYLISLSDSLTTLTFYEQYKQFILSLTNLEAMLTYSDSYRTRHPLTISEVNVDLTKREKTALRLRYNPILSWLYDTNHFIQELTQQSESSTSGIFAILESTVRTIPGVHFHKGETALESFSKAISDAARSAEEAYITPLTRDAIDLAILKRQESAEGFPSPSQAHTVVKFSSGISAFFTGPLGQTSISMNNFFERFHDALKVEFLNATISLPTMTKEEKKTAQANIDSLVKHKGQITRFLEAFKTLQSDFKNAEKLTLEVINGGDNVHAALETLEEMYGTTPVKRIRSTSLTNGGVASQVEQFEAFASRSGPSSSGGRLSASGSSDPSRSGGPSSSSGGGQRYVPIIQSRAPQKPLPALPILVSVMPALSTETKSVPVVPPRGTRKSATQNTTTTTVSSVGCSVKERAKQLELRGLNVSRFSTAR